MAWGDKVIEPQATQVDFPGQPNTPWNQPSPYYMPPLPVPQSPPTLGEVWLRTALAMMQQAVFPDSVIIRKADELTEAFRLRVCPGIPPLQKPPVVPE